MLTVALLCQLAAAAALPLTSHDAYANLTYGRILERGGDPFRTTPRAFFASRGEDPYARLIDPYWRETPCAYGPIVVAVDALAVRAGGDPHGALVVFKIAMAAAALLGIGLAWWMSSDAPGFALLALNPLYAWELTGQAHNDALLVPLAVLFVWGVRRNRTPLAALALAVSFLVKPVLLPVLGLWLAAIFFSPGPRARAPRIGGALALTGAALALGWWPFWTGPETLTMAGRALVGGHVEAANSLAEGLWHLTRALSPALGAHALQALRVIGLGVAAAAGLVALARVRRGADVIDQSLVFLLVFLGAVVWFQPWYVVWTLPFAAGARDRRLALIAALYGAAFLLAYVSDLFVLSWLVHGAMLIALALLRRSRSARLIPAAEGGADRSGT